MKFVKNGIEIDITEWNNTRAFIKHCIEEVNTGKGTLMEFFNAMQEVMTDPRSPLTWDDVVLMRVAKGNNELVTKQNDTQDPGIKEYSGRSGDDRYNHASVSCCRARESTGT